MKKMKTKTPAFAGVFLFMTARKSAAKEKLFVAQCSGFDAITITGWSFVFAFFAAWNYLETDKGFFVFRYVFGIVSQNL